MVSESDIFVLVCSRYYSTVSGPRHAFVYVFWLVCPGTLEHKDGLTSSVDSVMVVVILEPRKMTGMVLISTEVMVVT